MLGYGETAPYGELDYKGEVYVDGTYFVLASSLLIEQYRKPYINSASVVTTVVDAPAPTPESYPDAAVSLMFEQYKKDYING